MTEFQVSLRCLVASACPQRTLFSLLRLLILASSHLILVELSSWTPEPHTKQFHPFCHDFWSLKVHLSLEDTPKEFLADILNNSQYIFVILSKHTHCVCQLSYCDCSVWVLEALLYFSFLDKEVNSLSLIVWWEISLKLHLLSRTHILLTFHVGDTSLPWG